MAIISTISTKRAKTTLLAAAVMGVVALVGTRPAPAGVITWQNSGSNWNTGANWGGSLPTTSDAANLPSSSSSVNPDLSATTTIGALVIDNTQNDYSITQSNTPTLNISRSSADVAANTAFKITGGGTTSIAPNVAFTALGGAQTYIFDLGSATLNLDGATSFANSGTRTLNVTGANSTLNFNGGLSPVSAATTNRHVIFSGANSGTILVNGFTPTGPAGTSLQLQTAASFDGVLALSGSLNGYGSNVGVAHQGGTIEIRGTPTYGAGFTTWSWTSNTGSALRAGTGGGTITNTLSLVATGTNTVPNTNFPGVIGGSNDLTIGTLNANSTNAAQQTVTISNTGLTSIGTFNIGDSTSNNRSIAIDTTAANVTVEITAAFKKQNASGVGTFAKFGPGTVILKTGAAASYTGTTTVAAGKFVVDGTHTTAGAYSVNNGGTLAGSGTITTSAASNLIVASGGKLAPGSISTPGNLALNLGAASLNIGGTAADNAGQFTFRLGTNSDKITLGAASFLTLGAPSGTDNSLDWSDFTFSVGPGFADGNYTLIDAGTNASGGLSTGAGLLTGSIGGGTGVLSISGGQDLVLTVSGISPVVPEPASLALFAMGGLALVRRRR